MAELINFSNGIRGARVDPLLCPQQSKKLVPEARGRRNSFSSKENNAASSSSTVVGQHDENASAVVGRKHLTAEFEKKVHSNQASVVETRRKSNPEGYLKQTTQERVSLGKKMANSDLASRGLANSRVCAAMDETIRKESITSSFSGAENSFVHADHFQKSSMVPEQGASPKKGGLRYMSGPPEFVADPYVAKKIHTHVVTDARAKNSSVANLFKAEQNNHFSVASTSSVVTTAASSVVRPRANNSSATYNIITGQ